MGTPFMSEIRLMSFTFPPKGWALCNGQILAINQNQALFSLLGTNYGGNGQSTFALPDLRGRLPLHQGTASSGNAYTMGQTGGVEQVQLNVNQIPSHTHPMSAVDQAGNQTSPSGNLPAQSFDVVPYVNDVPGGTFNAAAVSAVGGSQPHTNLQPYLCVDFIISLFGVFPSQT